MRRRRSRGRLLFALGSLVFVTVLVLVLASGVGTPLDQVSPASQSKHRQDVRQATSAIATDVNLIGLQLQRAPHAGLLIDATDGRVLWGHYPQRQLKIASLTKMMTALVATDRIAHGSSVKVTKEALSYKGSGVGVLPRGKSVGVETMLNGLLLPSGNDAAIALAQRAAGTTARFVALMNERAQSMGLRCTHFSSADGFKDAQNYSCAGDLAKLAVAVLGRPRLARIVQRARAVMPFPVQGGRIFLYNNNPLIRTHYPGVEGVKTGYTNLAGRCLVASAKRHGKRLIVVLLHSYNPGIQARKILNRGFVRG